MYLDARGHGAFGAIHVVHEAGSQFHAGHFLRTAPVGESNSRMSAARTSTLPAQASNEACMVDVALGEKPYELPESPIHSHSIVSCACKYLNAEDFCSGRADITVRLTAKQCCLRAIDAE
jgi:hypothetical protein